MKYQVGLWDENHHPKNHMKSEPLHNLSSFLLKLSVVEKLAKTYNRTDDTQCLLCNKCVGSTMYIMMAGKDRYVWPSSYKHYLSKHNVMPDKILMSMVLALYKNKVPKNKQ